MAERARVESIDSLRDFRIALVEFADSVQRILEGVESENRKVRDWLEHEQPRYWKRQIQVWNQRLGEARSALHRKNLQRSDGFIPDVSQEKEALRIAKNRLEESEQKLASIRRWVPQLQHALSDYHGNTRGLNDFSSNGVERMLAMLDKMIESLEAYVSLAPPPLSSERATGSESVVRERPTESDSSESTH